MVLLAAPLVRRAKFWIRKLRIFWLFSKIVRRIWTNFLFSFLKKRRHLQIYLPWFFETTEKRFWTAFLGCLDLLDLKSATLSPV